MSFLLSWAGLSALLPIAGWLGLGGSVALGALAVAWLMPPFRRIALTVAAVAAIATAVFGKGVHHGAALVQAKWDAAEQRAVEKGSNARAEAEREIPAVTRKPSRGGAVSDWVRNDPDNRDNDRRNVRGVAKD